MFSNETDGCFGHARAYCCPLKQLYSVFCFLLLYVMLVKHTPLLLPLPRTTGTGRR